MVLMFLRIIFMTFSVIAISMKYKTVSAFSSNDTDHQALISLKKFITGDPLRILSSWNNSVHFCLWKGITCSRRHQRVTELNLSSQRLEGTLSPYIGNLTFLRTINLNTNSFHGSIPNEIGHLFRLGYLHLSDNSFHGGFPANMTSCLDIRMISLFGNNLGGNLPDDQFGSWSKLNVFILESNNFTGSIPPSVKNMSSLQKLILSTNNLEGSIPSEVGYLSKLEFLALDENNFSGMVPLPVYNISFISVIVLGYNKLEGSLPPNMGFTLLNLQEFYAGGNKLSGPLPPSLGNASKLVKFSIAGNNIIGPLQINFGRLSDLEVLDLGDNPVGHNQPSDDLGFLNSLVNCTRLVKLGLFGNGLRGELPKSIVNISTTIQILDLFDNYIYGSIPQDIGKLVNLTRLGLGSNILTGSIPESIGQLSELGQLFLYGNNFTGEIPAMIGNITGLLVLSLYSNMLQGSIPAALFNMSTLTSLDISENRLSGVVPEQVSGLSSLSNGLYLYQNLFTGPLPSNIGRFKHLVELKVSDNQFTGKIPDTLGDCIMLEVLDMEENYFEGRIPDTFKALKSLSRLDLSSNNLSGNIPSFLGEFHLMQILNLSHNRFEGEVPKGGLFSNISAFSVVGNLQLCGGIQALHLPACTVQFTRTEKKQTRARILLIVLLPLAILLACFTLFYRFFTSKRKNISLSLSQDDHYPRVSYQDILLATNEFSPANLLGEGIYGKVYKGVFESLQKTLVVKVLNVEVRGANKSFLAECAILRDIRHRNLVKIITACSTTDFKGNDFKALVFEFMANGSLDNWLHPSPGDKGNERSLTLLQRLNISIDVALAVDYLHHRNHTRIIHCDIKPSNILLDEEFVARVGDFGLARFFLNTASEINEARTGTTGVQGTVGYVPSEYGMGGEVSAEGDVYSYGITLLELFCGKRPTDNSFPTENANNLHEYVRMAFPHRVLDIADPLITSEAKQSYERSTIEMCLASIFEVGILCSVEVPKERIDISVALKQLILAKDFLLNFE